MERLWFSSLPDMNPFLFVIGHTYCHSALGFHAHPDYLPVVDDIPLSELPLDGCEQMIGANADKKMPLKATVFAVIHRAQSEIAF